MKLLLQAWHANSIGDWSMAALLTLVTLLVLIVARHVAERVLKAMAKRKSIATLSQLPTALMIATRLWLLIPLSLYVGATAVDLPPRLDSLLQTLLVIGLLIQGAFWANALINLWLTGEIEKRRATDGEAVTALSLMQFVARVMVWTLILLVILNHLNFNISALVTGLGVGGVAVALAVQNILGDLFASLSIVLDKPFVVGDFIIVDDYMGAVENVGLKTTRVRSLSGELIVFSNADLLKSRVRNYKRMFERRVVFTLGVSYGTPEEQLAAIPVKLREAVLANNPVRFDRAHLKEFGESALTFEVVYFVLDPDFNKYMDIQHNINLEIYRYFNQRRIGFAHPMRVLQAGDGALPVAAFSIDPAHASEPRGPRAPTQSKQQTGDQNWTQDAIA